MNDASITVLFGKKLGGERPHIGLHEDPSWMTDVWPLSTSNANQLPSLPRSGKNRLGSYCSSLLPFPSALHRTFARQAELLCSFLIQDETIVPCVPAAGAGAATASCLLSPRPATPRSSCTSLLHAGFVSHRHLRHHLGPSKMSSPLAAPSSGVRLRPCQGASPPPSSTWVACTI